MDDHTRDLFERCVQRLKEYRDSCEDDGMTTLVRSIDQLCEEVQIELDTAPSVNADPFMTIRLVDEDGEFISFKQLQHTIYRKVLAITKSMSETAFKLKLGRSTLYRHNEIFPLIYPKREREKKTA